MDAINPPADCLSSPLTKGGKRGGILRLTPPLTKGGKRESIDFVSSPITKWGERGNILHSPPDNTLFTYYCLYIPYF